MQWASPDQASKTWYNANRGPSRPPRKSEGLRCFVCMKTCKCRSWFILPWDLEGEICQHGTNLCGLTACVHSAKQDECQASCGRRAPQQKSQTLTPEASCRGKTQCLPSATHGVHTASRWKSTAKSQRAGLRLRVVLNELAVAQSLSKSVCKTRQAARDPSFSTLDPAAGSCFPTECRLPRGGSPRGTQRVSTSESLAVDAFSRTSCVSCVI